MDTSHTQKLRRRRWGKILRPLVTFGAFLSASLLATPASAKEFRLNSMLQTGIESGEFLSAARDDQKFNGLSIGALLNVPYNMLSAGLGLSYLNWSWTAGDSDWGLSQFYLSTEAGLQFQPMAKLQLAALLGYDLGLFGTVESTTGNTTLSADTTGFSRRTHTLRGLYQIADKIRLGGDLKFMTGTADFELASTTSEPDFDAWSLRLLVDYALLP